MCLCPAAIAAFVLLGVYLLNFPGKMCDIEVKATKIGELIIEVEELRSRLTDLRHSAGIGYIIHVCVTFVGVTLINEVLLYVLYLSHFVHRGGLLDEMLKDGLRRYYDQNELFLPPVRTIASQTTPDTQTTPAYKSYMAGEEVEC